MNPMLAWIIPANLPSLPSRPVDPGYGVPGPVDPGYGVPAPPPTVWPGPGYPAHPIAPGGRPPGIWGGGNEGFPTPPIYHPGHPDHGLPSQPPGIWPSPGHPAHPIAPGGRPPHIWGGPWLPPYVDNSLPPAPPPPDPNAPHPEHPIQPAAEYILGWVPGYGLVWVKRPGGGELPPEEVPPAPTPVA